MLVAIMTTALSGTVWADSYTITFGNNANSATGISSTTNATTVISSGTDYVTTKPFTVNSGNVYYGDTKTCIRIGKSGKSSELTIALSEMGQVEATSIVVNCKNMGGKNNNNAELNVNSLGSQTTTTTEADYTFTYSTATDITNIVLEGTAAIYIYSITVNYNAPVVEPLANIAALTANTETGTYYVALSNAVVTYTNGNYAYIQDASGAVVMYKSGHGLTAGDVLNGTATVSYQLRNSNPQITALTGVTSVSGSAPDPVSVAASAWNYTFNDVLSQYFQVTGATLTQSEGKYYVELDGENVQLYKVGTAISTLDLTKTYTITGFPTLYNTTKQIQIFADPEVEITTDPTIIATLLSLTGFTYEEGNGPSDAKTFTVSGANLSENISLNLGSNSDFEISTSENSGYTNTLSLTQSSGSVAETTIYVRLKSDLTTGNSYSGTITLSSTGATNVTVSLSGSVTAPVVTASYILATSITSGKRYVIANGTEDGTVQVMGNQANNNRPAVEATITDGVLSVSDEYEFVIESATIGEASGYSIYDENVPGYLYAASSTANQLKTEAELDENNNGIWAITIAEETGVATVIAQGTNTRNVMQYNPNTSNNNPLFACYGSASQAPVYLFEKVEEEEPITVTVGETLYTTFVAPADVSFSENLTAYIVTAYSSTAATLAPKASVPAGTPVVVKATEAGTYTLEKTTTPEDVTGNKLLASDGTQTGGDGIYALSTLKGTAPVGFYPVAATVTIPAGKAYLNTGVLVKGYVFDFEDDPTGIENLNANVNLNEGAIYNLAGQRLQKMQKGINIVNGKKIIK